MHEVAVNPWVAFAYLVAGVCFILALRGLSSPSTSQRGNRLGMIGMAIAVVTTLVTHVPQAAVQVVETIGPIGIATVGWTPDYVSIAEIVAGVPGSGDVSEELATLLHVDSTKVLNALEEVLKDHSVDNVQELLDAAGVHGL